MFLPLRRARWPLHTKMGRICKVAVEMTRRINRGESQTGYSPALGNPHQTRVPTFPQRRRRRGAWQRRGQTPLKSGSLPDSCTEPEKLSLRIVGFCFIALAVYITYEALADLLRKTAPEHSIPGIALACVSLIVMPILSRAKRRVGSALGSAAMKADARQTDFCVYLSTILLAGLLLNAVLGWWWADPIAALVMVPIILKEGVDGIRA